MILSGVTLTPGLARMLASRNDDGTPALIVQRVLIVPEAVAVYRFGHDELSASEQIRVRATLAAHAAESL